jgi:hypothetical protein
MDFILRLPLLMAALIALPWVGSAQAGYVAATGTATGLSATCNPGLTQSFGVVAQHAPSLSPPDEWNFLVVQDGGLESATESGGSLCELGLQGAFQGPWSPVVGGCVAIDVPDVHALLCLEDPTFLAPHLAVYTFHYEYLDGRPTWDGSATLAFA